MIVQLKLFAGAQQAAGTDELTLELADDATVAELRRQLIALIPGLKRWETHLRFAVDHQYAGDHQRLLGTEEIACFPPVSGG